MIFNNEKIEELLKKEMSHEELVKELISLGYKVNEVIKFTAMKKIDDYKYDLSNMHITTKGGTITKVYYKYLEEFEQVASYSPSIKYKNGAFDMEARNLKSTLVLGYRNELYLFDGRTTNKEPIDTGFYSSFGYGIFGASRASVDMTFKARLLYATDLEYHLDAKLRNGKKFIDYLKDDNFINLIPVEYQGILKRARSCKSSHSKITLGGKGTRVRVVSGSHTFDLSLGLAKELFSSQNVGYMSTMDLTESDYCSAEYLTTRDMKNNTEKFQQFVSNVLDNYNIRKDLRIEELCEKLLDGKIKFEDKELSKVASEMATRKFNIIC